MKALFKVRICTKYNCLPKEGKNSVELLAALHQHGDNVVDTNEPEVAKMLLNQSVGVNWHVFVSDLAETSSRNDVLHGVSVWVAEGDEGFTDLESGFGLRADSDERDFVVLLELE